MQKLTYLRLTKGLVVRRMHTFVLRREKCYEKLAYFRLKEGILLCEGCMPSSHDRG